MIPSYVCDQRTIDFLLRVKQTRTYLKQAKGFFNEVRACSDLPEPLKLTLYLLLDDWHEVVRYHRKRTYAMLLHNDLILSGDLLHG